MLFGLNATGCVCGVVPALGRPGMWSADRSLFCRFFLEGAHVRLPRGAEVKPVAQPDGGEVPNGLDPFGANTVLPATGGLIQGLAVDRPEGGHVLG